jgi:hypothetical protein
MRGIFFARCVARTFQQGTIAFQRLNYFFYFSFQFVLDLVKSIMNIPTETTYVTSLPKRNDITGAPNQVFKFDNLLDYLTGSIRAKTIAAIGTINPGSLCIQYLFAPQIHYDLSSTPIAFIGNSSNKKGEFSMIKVNTESIRAFAYIKDKATWTPDLIHGEDICAEKLVDTDWKDFEDPIVGTLISNFFIAYFG